MATSKQDSGTGRYQWTLGRDVITFVRKQLMAVSQQTYLEESKGHVKTGKATQRLGKNEGGTWGPSGQCARLVRSLWEGGREKTPVAGGVPLLPKDSDPRALPKSEVPEDNNPGRWGEARRSATGAPCTLMIHERHGAPRNPRQQASLHPKGKPESQL